MKLDIDKLNNSEDVILCPYCGSSIVRKAVWIIGYDSYICGDCAVEFENEN